MAIQYTAEVASRASAWLAYSTSKRRTVENVAELHAIYQDITGQPAAGCTFCGFSNYVDILTAYVRQFQRLSDPTLMADSQYTLAPGYENETFVHESRSTVLKADNITDSEAEFFVKNGFRHAFLKNGKAIPEPKAEGEGSEGSEPPKPKKKADWQALYKEVLGTEADASLTIDQLEEAIKAKQAELDKQD